jgi:hypothetical protein
MSWIEKPPSLKKWRDPEHATFGSTVLAICQMPNAKCQMLPYCLNTTIANGGRFSNRELSKPWVGMGSVRRPPKLPSSVPP